MSKNKYKHLGTLQLDPIKKLFHHHFLFTLSLSCFFSQVTGNPALIFRHRDRSDLALYQLPAHSKDANVTFRRPPKPDALTLL